jgi:hypothetical protein
VTESGDCGSSNGCFTGRRCLQVLPPRSRSTVLQCYNWNSNDPQSTAPILAV